MRQLLIKIIKAYIKSKTDERTKLMFAASLNMKQLALLDREIEICELLLEKVQQLNFLHLK